MYWAGKNALEQGYPKGTDVALKDIGSLRKKYRKEDEDELDPEPKLETPDPDEET